MDERVLTIVVVIKYQEDRYELVKQALKELAIVTRGKANGCINHHVYEDLDNKAFIIHENWSTKQAWLTHLSSEYMQRFSDMTKTYTTISLNTMYEIDVDN